MEIYSGLITGGLGLPACRGIIPMRFHLFAQEIPSEPGGGSPGSYPLNPGSVQNFYQEVGQPKIPLDTQSEPYYVPMEYDPRPKQIYKVVVQFGGREFEKTVILNRRGRKVLFSVLNFTNATINRINITVEKFKKIVTRVKVSVLNFKRKS